MNPLLIIAAIAAAFGIGIAYQRRKAEGALPWGQGGGGALPPLGAESPNSPEGAANLAAWSQLDFDVDLFPAGAQREWLRPPSHAGGVSVGPECIAIAVGHGVWDRAQEIAEQGIANGQTNAAITQMITQDLFNAARGCIDLQSPAGMAVVDDVRRRVRTGRYLTLSYLGPIAGAVQPGAITPTSNRRPRTVGEAMVLRALTGRSWRDRR